MGWKRGSYSDPYGYVRIHKPDEPSAGRDGYILEHRHVYETTRGIRLSRDIAIHHINGMKNDNRPENLIATTRKQHIKIHLRAGQVIALFLDERLLAAAKAYVREHGELPDLETLTQQVYG